MKLQRSLLALALLTLSATAQDTPWRELFPAEGLDGWNNPFDWGEVWREGEEVQIGRAHV